MSLSPQLARVFSDMKPKIEEYKQTDAYTDRQRAREAMGYDQAEAKKYQANIQASYDKVYKQQLKLGKLPQTAERVANEAKQKALKQYTAYQGKFKPNESQSAQATMERQLRDMGSSMMLEQFGRSEEDREAKAQYLAQQKTGFGALSDALGQYQNIASGEGPSVARDQYAQSRDDIMRQQMSLASMGGTGGALAAGQAGQQFGNLAPQLAQGAAVARSQEQLGALGAQSQVAGQMLGQQLGAAQLMQQGEMGYQGYGGQSMGFLQGQQQSLMDQDFRNASLEQQMAIARMEQEMQRRQQNMGILSALIGAGGAAGGAALGVKR